MSEYRYKEDLVIQELQRYVLETRAGHYNQGSIQPCEYLASLGGEFLTAFIIGNVVKYLQRYTVSHNKRDLLKSLHYLIILFGTTIADDKIKPKTDDIEKNKLSDTSGEKLNGPELASKSHQAHQ